jgi:ABC transport system ATP-binding/permease protein
MAVLLSCQNLAKTYGTRCLFQGVSLSIHDGDRIGLIGPNGSGKSTLLKIIAGLEVPDLHDGSDGQAGMTMRKNLRVGYVAQRDVFDDAATVLEVVAGALADSFHDDHEREARAQQALVAVGLVEPAQRVGSLSGGWRKRLSMARQMARQPDLLLMDEPTNHLDAGGIEWLEQMLVQQPFACVVVTHDRYFLEAAVKRVVELSRAYPRGTFAVEGPYSTFLQRRAEFMAAQAQQQQSLASKVREDLKWLARGAKARRTKSKSRIDASFVRMEELADLKSRNAPAVAAGVDFTATGRQTHKLLDAKALAKSMGGKRLFADLDVTLSPGTRLGLLGDNGSGKTTLIRLLTGELQPDAGTIKRADGLRTVTFTQNREDLELGQPLRQALCPVSDFVTFRGRQLHVNTWASRFLFRPDQLNTSVGDLSGGEQARILIARLMLKEADLLILDEPTNDLDIASLEVLEQSLLEFPGALVLVTHDRFMLDRLSTLILALDQGQASYYAELAQWREAQDQRDRQQRQAAAARPEPATAAIAAAESPAIDARRIKLSYKEQRELDQMESNITTAEAEVQRLEALLADPATVADHRRMQTCCQQLDAAHARVTELYTRWQDLEARAG